MTPEEQATANRAAAAAKITPEQQKAVDAAEVDRMKIVLSGLSPGVFCINGSGFGPSGSLTIGGVAITNITRWEDETVRGALPAGMKGQVVLTPSNGKPTRYGHYPELPRPLAVRTTVVEVIPTK